MMGVIIKFLLGLSPALTAFLGAGAALAAFMAWNVLIDNPQVWREASNRAEDACTIRTQDAANRAEAAERERQRIAQQSALDAYNAAVAAQETAKRGALDAMEKQIDEYELQLATAGRSCPLDAGDIDWLQRQSNGTVPRR